MRFAPVSILIRARRLSVSVVVVLIWFLSVQVFAAG
jgi:hypothetical protein